jgi:hypothetical protein
MPSSGCSAACLAWAARSDRWARIRGNAAMAEGERLWRASESEGGGGTLGFSSCAFCSASAWVKIPERASKSAWVSDRTSASAIGLWMLCSVISAFASSLIAWSSGGRFVVD